MKFGFNSRDGVDLAMRLFPELRPDDGDDDDLFIRETTPPKVTPDILDFCSDIGAGNPPVFVAVEAAPKARAGWCVNNVAEVLVEKGGEPVHGWTIWGGARVVLHRRVSRRLEAAERPLARRHAQARRRAGHLVPAR